MSDREAFIRHIGEHPHADLPRLVFADWLDERDDPLGLFIRTQFELDPIRDQIELPRVRELLEVEGQLLNDHRQTWLEPAVGSLPHSYARRPHFRRGLPYALCLTAQDLGEHGERLMEAFPTVRELAVCELNGDPEAVANHEFLRRVDVLELADIPDPHDFATVLEGDLFGKQPIIRLWNGYFGTCPLFGITPEQWKPSGVVEYVQLLGGVTGRTERYYFDQEADECAAEFNTLWGEGKVRVVRPFNRTFPLHQESDSFPVGRLPSGRFGMVFSNGSLDRNVAEVMIAEFDGPRHVATRYTAPPLSEYWDGFLAWVRGELQLQPESFRVSEFLTERRYGVQWLKDWWNTDITRERFDHWAELWEWMHNGGYVIEGMGGHWADNSGFVTAS